MTKIFGKLKNDSHAIIYDDAGTESIKEIYKIPNVTLAIPFEVDSRGLAEGEWYYIVPTEEQKEEMLGEYVSEVSGISLSTIVPDYYREIKIMYTVYGDEKLFTKVTSRHILRAQKYVAFKEKPELVEQANSLLLDGEVDAYWNGTRLYFQKFTVARALFPGIQKTFKELTEEKTNEFLSSALFELKDEMSSDFISLSNRKKISTIIDSKTVNLKDPVVCNSYLEYAKEYNLDLEINDDKIALIDNSDVAKVISLLGESFYTSEINKEKREIRSSRKLNHGKRKRAR